MSNQRQVDELRCLSLKLSERDYRRLIWLKAWISKRKKRTRSIEETVKYLLDREDRIKQTKLWIHTGLIFIAITAVLFLPFGVSIKALFMVAGLGLVLGLFSFYFLTPSAFKKAALISEADITAFLEELSKLAGFRDVPRPLLLDTPEINAMALSGRQPCVVLTRGLVEAYTKGLLTKEELGAIIGHELGHLKHHDGLRRSLAYSWISVFFGGGEIVTQVGISIIARAQAEQDSSIASLFVQMYGLLIILFGLFAKMLAKIASALYFYLSRRQEYDADDVGAQLTHPNAMNSALKKIEELNFTLVQTGLQQLPFPDLWQVKPKKLSVIDRLWTTHPPMDERIARQAEFAQFIQ
jgi:heat shock protein HtpX